MSKPKFTPGRGKLKSLTVLRGWCDVAGFLEAACTCYGKKAEVNAALIAAAPEMYEALADIAENCWNHG